MLTEYGKFIRKYRIDKNMSLRDMAKQLSVSPTFLSNVEMGHKTLPKRLISEIIKLFNMNDANIDELLVAIKKSKPYSLKIKIIDYSIVDIQIMKTFMKNHNKISDNDKQQILTIIEKN